MDFYFLIDGQRFDDSNFDGSNGASITINRTSEASEDVSVYSATIELRGSAYSYIYENLVCAPNPRLVSAECVVYSSCCKNEDGSDLIVFNGKIKGSDLNWCENKCSLTATVSDNSEDGKKLKCLKNILIYDRESPDGSIATNGEDQFRQSPYLTYCLEIRPKVLHEVIMILGILMINIIRPIVFVVALIVTVINAIIGAVNNIPGVNIDKIDFDGNDDTNAFEEMNAWLNQLRDYIVACGRKHKTPFVHSYLENIASLCGMTLESSIFGVGGYYHNSIRLDATNYEKGQRTASKIEETYRANRPNLNGRQYLDSLKEFNIDWRIDGNILRVEHRSELTGEKWFDIDELEKDQVIRLCYSFDTESPCAYGDYSYTKDGVDKTGDEVRPEWAGVIDWNSPPQENLEGLCDNKIRYGTAQFRRDKFRPDVAAIDKPIYDNALAFPNLKQYKNVLLMDNGTTTLPKLLTWDGESDLEDARVERIEDGGLHWYNYRWYVKEGFQENTAYQVLFFDDDPRLSGVINVNYELTINYTCSILKSMSPNKLIGLTYKGQPIDGKVSKITVNTSNKTLNITGKI